MNPDFIIVGAQKAGSTALMRSLRMHPNVQMPAGETRYFRDPWFQFEDPSVLLQPTAGDREPVSRWGIKSPDLLGITEAPARIKQVLGTPDLIAILRNPVERALSGYYWLMQWGLLPLERPETGLRSIMRGQWRGAYPRSDEVLGYGRYGTHLENYLAHFPRHNVLVLLTDDLRESPQGAQDRITDFLGIPRAPVRSGGRRVNAGVYSMKRLAFLSRRHPYILREYAGYEGKFIQAPVGVSARIKDKAIAGVDRIALARIYGNSPETISDDLRRELTEYYREDVELTQRLLDRDLSAWLAP